MPSQYEDFDPKKHKGKQIYELQSRDLGNAIATVVVKSDVSFEDAAKTPWYYVVEAE